MVDTRAALAHACIELRNITAGDHRTTCPQCSHTRHNKKEPCLSVTIEDDGVPIWNCHHCGWTAPTATENPDYYRALHGNDEPREPSRARTRTRAKTRPPGKPPLG